MTKARARRNSPTPPRSSPIPTTVRRRAAIERPSAPAPRSTETTPAPKADATVLRPDLPARSSRMCYGQVRLAPIDAVVSLHPLELPDDPLRRIHPRVADTNMILDQLVASTRKPKPIALMTTIHDGGLRL